MAPSLRKQLCRVLGRAISSFHVAANHLYLHCPVLRLDLFLPVDQGGAGRSHFVARHRPCVRLGTRILDPLRPSEAASIAAVAAAIVGSLEPMGPSTAVNRDVHCFTHTRAMHGKCRNRGLARRLPRNGRTGLAGIAGTLVVSSLCTRSLISSRCSFRMLRPWRRSRTRKCSWRMRDLISSVSSTMYTRNPVERQACC